MKNPIRHRGVADVAFAAYAHASKEAGIDITTRGDYRVTQAVGNAPASKGFHAPDGTLDGEPYTAALDVRSKDLSHTQIASLLEELCAAGFIAFYRNWTGNLHIHANYAGLPQKDQLDKQNEEFFRGEDGLVGHGRIDDEWWYPEKEVRRIAESMFRLSNPRNGSKGIVVASPAVVHPAEVQPVSAGLYLNNETKPRFWMPVFNGVSYAPVRAFGASLGLDVEYDSKTHSIKFDEKDQPIALKMVAGVGHAPLRQLVREVGLRLALVDIAGKKVVVTR